MPFGSARPGSGEITETSYLYTDQEFDTENGLYNYNARLYDPVIGRFISPDTIVPNPLNPQSLNRYTYCLNNPLIYVDPSGHETGTRIYRPKDDNVTIIPYSVSGFNAAVVISDRGCFIYIQMNDIIRDYINGISYPGSSSAGRSSSVNENNLFVSGSGGENPNVIPQEECNPCERAREHVDMDGGGTVICVNGEPIIYVYLVGYDEEGSGIVLTRIMEHEQGHINRGEVTCDGIEDYHQARFRDGIDSAQAEINANTTTRNDLESDKSRCNSHSCRQYIEKYIRAARHNITINRIRRHYNHD